MTKGSFIRLGCGAAILSSIAIGFLVLRGLYHNDLYGEDAQIRKHKGTFEKMFAVSFPASTEFRYRWSHGGLMQEMEALKITMDEEDLPQFREGLRIIKRRRLEPPPPLLASLHEEDVPPSSNGPSWGFRSQDVEDSVVGRAPDGPGYVEVTMSRCTNHKAVVHLVWWYANDWDEAEQRRADEPSSAGAPEGR